MQKLTDWIDFREGIELLLTLLVPPLGSAVVQEAYIHCTSAAKTAVASF